MAAVLAEFERHDRRFAVAMPYGPLTPETGLLLLTAETDEDWAQIAAYRQVGAARVATIPPLLALALPNWAAVFEECGAAAVVAGCWRYLFEEGALDTELGLQWRTVPELLRQAADSQPIPSAARRRQ